MSEGSELKIFIEESDPDSFPLPMTIGCNVTLDSDPIVGLNGMVTASSDIPIITASNLTFDYMTDYDSLIHLDRIVKEELENAKKRPVMEFSYVNHAGKFGHRKVQPLRLVHGVDNLGGFYKEPQWLLICWDVEKEAIRHFALNKFNKHPQIDKIDEDDHK